MPNFEEIYYAMPKRPIFMPKETCFDFNRRPARRESRPCAEPACRARHAGCGCEAGYERN